MRLNKFIQIAILIWVMFFVPVSWAQSITWTDITSQNSLPDGVKLFKGRRASPALNVWYLSIDTKKKFTIKPYTTPAGREEITSFAGRYNAVAAVNGGYFDNTTGTIYSAVVQPNTLAAKNVASVTRSSVVYPIARTFWSLFSDRSMSIDWIYHFGNTPSTIYKFAAPLDNSPNNPAQAPAASSGRPIYDLVAGIGGGPMLVKNGHVKLTYTEEVFWGSGVDSTAQPRTAIGYTQAQQVILLVADGRQTASDGLSLRELAQTMISLGCIEAMNLDGGGSSQMCVGHNLLNLPDGGGTLRTLPAILCVVPVDSLPLSAPLYYNNKIDTEDSSCTLYGGGWSASPYQGYWGFSQSQIAQTGNGEKYAKYNLNLTVPGRYKIEAWWAPVFGRCSAVPFIISRKGGIDTVKVNQTLNASQWNRIGEFQFTGSFADKLIISNAAGASGYIAADAVRITSTDSTLTLVSEYKPKNLTFTLEQNYPNPFNARTIINYELATSAPVSVQVFDLLGRQVTSLFQGFQNAGRHTLAFDASGLASGLYLYSLQTPVGQQVQKMILLK